MWELFSYGTVPYCELSNDQAAKKILAFKTLRLNEAWPEVIKELCSASWKKNTKSRPSFQVVKIFLNWKVGQEIVDKLENNLTVKEGKKTVESPYGNMELYQNEKWSEI